MSNWLYGIGSAVVVKSILTYQIQLPEIQEILQKFRYYVTGKNYITIQDCSAVWYVTALQSVNKQFQPITARDSRRPVGACSWQAVNRLVQSRFAEIWFAETLTLTLTLTLNPNVGESGRHQLLTLISANRVSANREDTQSSCHPAVTRNDGPLSLTNRLVHQPVVFYTGDTPSRNWYQSSGTRNL